jgi:hypothetical protein
VLEKYDQSVIYLDSAAYTKFARETFEAERETIHSLGLQAKS